MILSFLIITMLVLHNLLHFERRGVGRFSNFVFRLIKYFILPGLPAVVFSGFWSPILAIFLLLIGLVIGFLIYSIGVKRPERRTAPFISGESI